MTDAIAHLRCKVAWCQGIMVHAPGCPETPEEPVWTDSSTTEVKGDNR